MGKQNKVNENDVIVCRSFELIEIKRSFRREIITVLACTDFLPFFDSYQERFQSLDISFVNFE